MLYCHRRVWNDQGLRFRRATTARAGVHRCQCPHWGFVLKGVLTTIDAAGNQETVRANDLFYWPSGHNVKVSEDAEIIMFSPQREHTHVINHMREKIKGT